jgi:hypothetical protein
VRSNFVGCSKIPERMVDMSSLTYSANRPKEALESVQVTVTVIHHMKHYAMHDAFVIIFIADLGALQ